MGSLKWKSLILGQIVICSLYLHFSSFPSAKIRIDKLVDKWSGSIEIGVTTHNPNNLEYPATMTNLQSGNGSWMEKDLGLRWRKAVT